MLQKRKVLLDRILRAIIPLVLLGMIIIGSGKVQKTHIGPNTKAFYAKATVVEILEDHTNGEPFAGNQKVVATITSGEYKGQNCTLDNPNSYQNGALCDIGTKIIAMVRQNDAGSLVGGVYNYDRTAMVYLLLGLFAVVLILCGGKKGAASLYALIFTFVCIICVYIPLLYVGMNGILAAILTAVLILITSIYILNGWSIKSLCAIIGTTIGVAISGVLAMIVGGASNLSGFNMDEVEAMLYISNYAKLDVADILYAGVLISSLGAVMDVSVSIVAAMQEIHEKAPSVQGRELFASGMRVGHDMMGTMSNTLILAYTGSATSTLMTVYSYQMPYTQMMGYNSIVIEILCGLCGTIGVILTVPLQAFIAALVLKSKD